MRRILVGSSEEKPVWIKSTLLEQENQGLFRHTVYPLLTKGERI